MLSKKLSHQSRRIIYIKYSIVPKPLCCIGNAIYISTRTATHADSSSPGAITKQSSSRCFTTTSFKMANQIENDYEIDLISLKKKPKKKAQKDIEPMFKFDVPDYKIPDLKLSEYQEVYEEGTKPIYEEFCGRFNEPELPFTVNELRDLCEYACANTAESLSDVLTSFADKHKQSVNHQIMVSIFQQLLDSHPVFESHFNTLMSQTDNVKLRLERFFKSGLGWFSNELKGFSECKSKKQFDKELNRLIFKYEQKLPNYHTASPKYLRILFRVTRLKELRKILNSLDYPLEEIRYIVNLSKFEDCNKAIKEKNLSASNSLKGLCHFLNWSHLTKSNGNYTVLSELQHSIELHEVPSICESVRNHLIMTILKDPDAKMSTLDPSDFKFIWDSENNTINFMSSLMMYSGLTPEVLKTYIAQHLDRGSSRKELHNQLRKFTLSNLEKKLGGNYYDWIVDILSDNEFELAFLNIMPNFGCRKYECFPDIIPFASEIESLSRKYKSDGGFEKLLDILSKDENTSDELRKVLRSFNMICCNKTDILSELLSDKRLVEEYYDKNFDRFINEIIFIQGSARLDIIEFWQKMERVMLNGEDKAPVNLRLSQFNRLWGSYGWEKGKKLPPGRTFCNLQDKVKAVLINHYALGRQYQPKQAQEYKQIPDDLSIHDFTPQLVKLQAKLGSSFANFSPDQILEALQSQIDASFENCDSEVLASNKPVALNELRLKSRLERLFDTNGGNTQVLDSVLNSQAVFEKFEASKSGNKLDQKQIKPQEYKQIPDDLNIHDFTPQLATLKQHLGTSFASVSPKQIIETLQSEIDAQFENSESEVLASNKPVALDELRLKNRLERLFDINGGNTQVLDVVLNSQEVFKTFEASKASAGTNQREYKQIPDDLNIHDFTPQLYKLRSALGSSFASMSPDQILETLRSQIDSSFEKYDSEVMASNKTVSFDEIRLKKRLERLFDINGGDTQVLDSVLNSQSVLENFEATKVGAALKNKQSEIPSHEESIICTKKFMDSIKKDLKKKNDSNESQPNERPSTPVEIASGIDEGQSEAKYAHINELFSNLDKESTPADLSFGGYGSMMESLMGAIKSTSTGNGPLQPPSPPLFISLSSKNEKRKANQKSVKPPSPPPVMSTSKKDGDMKKSAENVRPPSSPPVVSTVKNDGAMKKQAENVRPPCPPPVISKPIEITIEKAIQEALSPDAEIGERAVPKIPKIPKKEEHSSVNVSALEDFLQQARKENYDVNRAKDALEWSTSMMYKGEPVENDFINNPNTSFLLLTVEGGIIPVDRASLGEIKEEDIFTILSKFEKSELTQSLGAVQRLKRHHWRMIGSRTDGDKKYFIMAKPKRARGWRIMRTIKTILAIIGSILITLVGINFFVDDLKSIEQKKEEEEDEAERIAEFEALARDVSGPFTLTTDPASLATHPDDEEDSLEESQKNQGAWLKNLLWK
ncbi:uncharacterized protein J8A68_000343 [[Candida] subhashii]|uniref:Uncharacterized protein n=1 Tax=[Candida] subhashii TaxID=561895 RepID=A0A8J5QN64_9ASCO|nr:uncharacterized protein J8A68_000343 [[Candida] subhashii]KAG7666087.1 hypothetical protein J8A68_000343 [[Candida] subhashii]